MGDVEARGGVALGVEVDDQDAVAVQGERDGQVDGGGGLAHAALLVRDAEDARVGRSRHSDFAARVQNLHGAESLHGQRRIVVDVRRFT
ncbi:hypothetical protein Sya03_19560 [Spirilliplanes yamanashiensis]|uniref:Uncharacterized protein n=1 Tax=Spirilliplanes yamanashiensis TaxID=42233 RepID=A0A8J3Y748_9ACTN|nr:hypothetical protein Sya03_19560 [Spirilliplanes yamanashiensis]